MLALASPTLASGSQGRPGDFDFLVLSLSWSPTWCAENRRDRGQCDVERPFGFVVHGLWPQYERGWPEYCDTGTPRISRRLIDAMQDIMPNPGLVGHQWRKHGACTGLDPQRYLALTRLARERVTVPQIYRNAERSHRDSARGIEDAFAAANPGLDSNEIALSCDGERLREVRICLDRKLQFRACEEVDAHGCRRRSVRLPAAR